MKEYKPLKMINKGRYRQCFATLNKTQQQQVLGRMEQLISENSQWCDRGNYGHLCNILPTLAIDAVLQASGHSPDQSLSILSHHMWAALKPEGMQRLAQRSFFMPLMKVVVPLGFNLKSGRGWNYVWHKDTDPSNQFHFECTECLYKHIFDHYGVTQRFGPMFCHSDIINYGALPHTDFIRTQTLCQGGQLCDFCFVRHQPGEEWNRTPSI